MDDLAQPLLKLFWCWWQLGVSRWGAGLVLTPGGAARKLKLLPATMVGHVQVIAAVLPTEARVPTVKTRRLAHVPLASPTALFPSGPMVMIRLTTGPGVATVLLVGRRCGCRKSSSASRSSPGESRNQQRYDGRLILHRSWNDQSRCLIMLVVLGEAADPELPCFRQHLQ